MYKPDEPSEIYFDLLSTNVQSTITAPPVFEYNNARATVIVNTPENYKMSVIRFSADTGTLPVFIPTIRPAQSDPNLTIYNFTLDWTDSVTGRVYTSGTVPVIWEPEAVHAEMPAAPEFQPNGLQNNATGYYNAYSFSYWSGLMYEALQRATDLLLAAAPGTALTANTAARPFPNPPAIYYDSSSKSFVLYADILWYNQGLVDPIDLYMNAPMYELMGSFPALNYGYAASLAQRNFRLAFRVFGDVNNQIIVRPDDTTWTAITSYQEWSTISAFSPILGFVFTSASLPIIPSLQSNPLIYNNLAQARTGTNASTANVITDFIADEAFYKPNLVYVPQSQYRWVGLTGTAPIQNIQISIFYRLRDGSLQPFLINSGGSVTIKLLFKRLDSP
jgi:hypothetical protein